MPTEYFGLTSNYQPANIPTTTPAPPVAQTPPAPAPVAQPQPAQPDQVFDPQAALAAARAAAAGPTVAQNGSPLFQKAVQLAAGAPDFASFLGLAFADAEILSDDELAERCADEGAGGVWATAHA